jgi:hypothetical protein
MLTDDLPAPQCERALTSIFLFCSGGASGKPASAMLVLLLASLLPHSALAHGIAGNRYFDGTMTFDDPSVADEVILPYYSKSAFPAQGSNTTENRINWAFARLLTPTWPSPLTAAGFTKTGPWATNQASTKSMWVWLVSPADASIASICSTIRCRSAGSCCAVEPVTSTAQAKMAITAPDICSHSVCRESCGSDRPVACCQSLVA